MAHEGKPPLISEEDSIRLLKIIGEAEWEQRVKHIPPPLTHKPWWEIPFPPRPHDHDDGYYKQQIEISVAQIGNHIANLETEKLVIENSISLAGEIREILLRSARE